MTDEIEARVKAFRGDLKTMSPEQVFTKHVVEQPCYALDGDEQAAVVNRISTHFGVPPEGVVIVGSAKLGFTLVNKDRPGRPMRPRYSPFSDDSDVDVAIISSGLFDKYWKIAYGFRRASVLWEDREKFERYLLRGWIIPLLLPKSTTDTTAVDWKRFFDSLVRSGDCGDYPVTGALYRDDHFFQTYHCDTIARLKALEEGVR